MESLRDDAEVHIPLVLERVKKEYLQKTYGIDSWEDAEVRRFLGFLITRFECSFIL